VRLDRPYAGVAPGQACVLYEGERLLGGGWICRDP
jgi:tRNA-specific 2-thiouridylase